MKKAAVTLSSLAVTLTFLLALVTPAAFAQGGGRGGGIGRGGTVAPGGAVLGGGSRGGVVTGSQGRFVGPRHHFRHGRFFPQHHFRRNSFFFGFGGTAFVPAWWWYDPYYYWGPPPGYYSTYYGYPSYDYYNYPSYDYYGDPYSSDPCLSSDPAFAQYCPQSSYPPQGDYGAPPVGYPTPDASAQPESGSVSPSSPAPEQPN